MKSLLLLTFIGCCLTMSSCTSEYEECVQEGKNLKARLAGLEQNNLLFTGEASSVEVKEIYNEINLLARVSGNEQLFLQEVFSH